MSRRNDKVTSCKHAGVVDYFDPFSLSELMGTVVVWVDHYSTRNSRQYLWSSLVYMCVIIQSLDDAAAALSIFSFLPAEILLLQFFPSKIHSYCYWQNRGDKKGGKEEKLEFVSPSQSIC